MTSERLLIVERDRGQVPSTPNLTAEPKRPSLEEIAALPWPASAILGKQLYGRDDVDDVPTMRDV